MNLVVQFHPYRKLQSLRLHPSLSLRRELFPHTLSQHH
nr:MAG TPA: hypothetical protein [Caudoviricetes sp.]DAP99901.1 MAG TPA: hypothetical protein [Caudoviricetes sp.]